MIKRIVFSLMFVCLIIAIPLALMGIKHVEIGGPFLAFMRNVNYDFTKYQLKIPNIPKIPMPDTSGGWWDVLGALITIANFFVAIGNFAITFMNFVIGIFQFMYLIIQNLFTLSENLTSNTSSSYIPPVV